MRLQTGLGIVEIEDEEVTVRRLSIEEKLDTVLAETYAIWTNLKRADTYRPSQLG